MYKEIIEFARQQTKEYDEGHGVEHALKVYETAMEIAKADFPEIDFTLLSVAALTHDVCDHKFCQEGDKTEILRKFLIERLGIEKAERIINITNSVSFSKEKCGKLEKLKKEEDEIIRTIVADADRIEAIGKVGIRRCFLYSKGAEPSLSFAEHVKHVITHAYEKLLRLYPEKYIKTKKAREIAEPLHNEMVEIIKRLEQGDTVDVN